MSFIESATLKVIDESSGAINKINAELHKLQATARSLKSISVSISVQDKGIQNAIRNLRSLNRELLRAKSASSGLNLGTHATGMQQAANQAQRLATYMTRINQQAGAAARQQVAAAAAAARPPAAAPTRRAAAARRAAAGGGVPFDPHIGYGFAAGLGGFAGVTAAAIAHHLGRETKKGIEESDISEQALRMKQIDTVMQKKGVFGPPDLINKPLEAALREDLKRIGEEKEKMYGPEGTVVRGAGGGFFNLAQRRQVAAEAFGITGDPGHTADMTSKVEELARTNFLLGGSMDQAADNAYNYIKGLDAMGRLTFHNADAAKAYNEAHKDEAGFRPVKIGDYSPERAAESIEYLQKIAPEIGKEMTGGFFRQISKYMSGSKYAADWRAIGATLLLGEDIGTRAAVGYNQAVKQLSGRGITKAINANQMAAGLGRAQTEASKNLLLHDLPKWLGEGLRDPATGQYIMGKDKKGRERPIVESFADIAKRKWGLDTTTPEGAYEAAAKVAGDRTAIDSIAAFLYNYQEIKKKLDQADLRSGKEADIRRLTADSPRVQFATLESQLQSTTAEFVKPLLKAAIPLSESIRQGLATKAADIEEKSRKGTLGPDDYRTIFAGLGGITELYAAKQLAEGNVPGAIATAGAGAMIAAGPELLKAGGLLSSAAQGLAKLFGIELPDKDKKEGDAKAKENAASKVVDDLIKAAPPQIRLPVEAAELAWGVFRRFMTPLSPEAQVAAKARSDLDFKQIKLAEDFKRLAAIAEEHKIPEGLATPSELNYMRRHKGEMPESLRTKIEAERTKLQVEIGRTLREIDELRTKLGLDQKPKPPEEKPPEPTPAAEIEQSVRDGTEKANEKGVRVIEDGRPEGVPVTTAGPPPALPWVPGTEVPAVPTVEPPPATPWSEDATKVSEAATTLQTGLSTGAGQIQAAASSLAEGGSQAASIIASGAIAAGAAYGAAAAAAISAAAANVHINVSQSGGKPDAGAQKTE